MSAKQISFSDQNSSNGVLNPNDNSKYSNESKLSDSSSGVNNGSSSYNNGIINISEKVNNSIYKAQLKNSNANPITIEINLDNNKIHFFIRILGYNLCHYQVNNNAKLKELIENYIEIEKIDGKKKDYYYCDKEINDQTIGQLEIENWSIITITLKSKSE